MKNQQAITLAISSAVSIAAICFMPPVALADDKSAAASQPQQMAAPGGTQPAPPTTGDIQPSCKMPEPIAPSGQAKTQIITKYEKKPGAVRRALHAMGSQLHAMTSDMGQDLGFVFSMSDDLADPSPPPSDKPYVISTIEYVDGSEALLVKNPDGSLRLDGGFANGTVLKPNGDGSYQVCYPNGAVGKMVSTEGGAKIYRPDDSVTEITKTDSGDFTISNTKLGYVGTAIPSDRTGLNYSIKDDMTF